MLKLSLVLISKLNINRTKFLDLRMANIAQEKKGKCPTFLNRKRPFLSSLLDTTVLVEFCQTSTLIDGLLLCTTEAWKSIYLPVFAFDIQISRRLICLV